MLRNDADIRAQLGLRPIINVSGTMTALGASIVVPEAIDAISRILGEFVEIPDLLRKASQTIARLTGAEAGFVTASASAGITIGVAAAMTGCDLARIEQLPDPGGMRNEVVIQLGHMVGYGAPVEQAIRLAGAAVVPVGQATAVGAYQLAGKISPRTAAGVYVVSHHVVQYGQLDLKTFCESCHEQGVPVIVDAASEYDLRGFLAAGADLAVYSAHKFLGGPTAGIMAGRKDLVRACYLQNRGIGRGMKVGKESIAGTIATLEAWEARDHDAVRARERAALGMWQARFARLPGVTARIVPDPTDNPLERLELGVGSDSGTTAWALAAALAAHDPPIIVRDHEAELGHFYLDPCNLHPGEAEAVADILPRVLASIAGQPSPLLAELRQRGQEHALTWPD